MTGRARRHGSGQQGATLIELLLAVGAAAILLLPTLAWSVVAMRQQPRTMDGLSRSADTGLMGAYLPEDVAVAGAAEVDGTPPADPNAVPVTFEDCQPAGGGDGGRVVLVLLSGGIDLVRTIYSEAPGSDGSGVSVWRRTCDEDGTGTESKEVFEDVDVDSTEALCDDGSATTTCRQVEFRTQPESSADPVVLSATRRADPASLAVDLTGNRLPVAKISVLDQTSGAPSQVTFSAGDSYDPDGPAPSYRWEFPTLPAGAAGAPAAVTVEGGGGGLASPQTRTFSQPGTYYVTLTVTDDSGASNVTYKAVHVDPRSPVASADVFPPVGNATETTFIFDGRPSSDPDGSIVSHRWVVGTEGAPGSIVHQGAYLSTTVPMDLIGTQTVTLTVTDNQGRAGSYVTTIVVNPPGSLPTVPGSSTTTTAPTTTLPGDPPPVAAYSVTELNPGQWAFDASGSSDNGEIVDHAWDLGDGTTGTGSAVTHLYGAPGQYTVTLTVTDDQGQTDSVSQLISVGGG